MDTAVGVGGDPESELDESGRCPIPKALQEESLRIRSRMVTFPAVRTRKDRSMSRPKETKRELNILEDEVLQAEIEQPVAVEPLFVAPAADHSHPRSRSKDPRRGRWARTSSGARHDVDSRVAASTESSIPTLSPMTVDLSSDSLSDAQLMKLEQFPALTSGFPLTPKHLRSLRMKRRYCLNSCKIQRARHEDATEHVRTIQVASGA